MNYISTMTELIEQVENWAIDKNIVTKDNWPKQLAKVVEELGELSSAMLKENSFLEIDSFGDVLVTLIVLAKQRDIKLQLALEAAYNEIKNRTGKTVNGTFIKD